MRGGRCWGLSYSGTQSRPALGTQWPACSSGDSGAQGRGGASQPQRLLPISILAGLDLWAWSVLPWQCLLPTCPRVLRPHFECHVTAHLRGVWGWDEWVTLGAAQ